MKGLPHPFDFYRVILKGDHLHFGLWPENRPELSMEDAQQLMFEHLLSFFPEPPASVLDAGCGLGLSASLLARHGYRVVAVAPSSELIDYARQTYGASGVEFRVLGFLDDDDEVFTPGAYDVLLFQESAQYIHSLNELFSKARALLKDRGTVIICDEVCYDSSIKPETAVHQARDFIVALAENGFRITSHEKIGENVLPTCDVIVNSFTANFDDIVVRTGGSDAVGQLQIYLDGWIKQKQWYSSGQMGYEVLAAKKDAFFIKPYTLGDEDRIIPMFNKIFNNNRTFDHWYWKFRNNPYGEHKISEVFSDNGTLVAHYAGYPVPFYSSLEEGQNLLSYQIGDTMTSPDVRNIGIGKTGLLARMASYFYAKFCEGSIPFIYGFNTGNIKKLGMRYLGYTYIDPVTLWVRDLAKSPFRSASLVNRMISGFSVEEVHEITDEWDTFFDRVCHAYTFLVRRDASYVRWRYFDCPDHVHSVFAVRKRGQLIGWSVVRKMGDKIIWGDALFDSRYPESASYLLSGLAKSEFSKCQLIEGWFSLHPEWWCSVLRRIGFTPVSEPNNLTPCFVIFKEPELLEKLRDQLYYTMGDSDLF